MDSNMVRVKDVIWRRIGDEIVVVKDDGLAVHVLNKTAAVIWETCAETCNPDNIAARLSECYTVSPREAKNDVLRAIEKMEEIGLLKQIEG